MKPILTIVIPCYNSEETIECTLSTIIDIQNIEIILINDGSTDNTHTIIKKYLEDYKNIKYEYQNNKGPGAARNKGIEMATGDYIMFLDSDDKIKTENLCELIDKYLKYKQYDVIYYNFEQILPNGQVYNTYRLEKFKELSKEELIKNTISWNLPWGQFKIIESRIIKENNIYFDEQVKNSEELFFTIQVLVNSNKIFFFDKIVYQYLKRKDSLSTKINLELSKNTVNFMVAKLKQKFENTVYQTVIYNYIVVFQIDLLRQTTNTKQYKIFKKTCKAIRKNLQNINCHYIAKRYQIILKIITFHLDFLLYLAFIIYFRRK